MTRTLRNRIAAAVMLLAASLASTSAAAQMSEGKQGASAGGGLSFAKAIIKPAPLLFAGWIAAGDINNDGRADLAVSDNNGGGGVCTTLTPLSVAGGGGFNGDGFGWVCGQTGAYGASTLLLADVNRDGNLDILSADADEPVVVVGYGNGKGQFYDGPFLSSDCGYATQALAVADLNGDGIPDIVATVLGAGDAPGCLTVFFGQGGDQFAPGVDVYSGGIWPFSVAVGDLNNDGIPDLVVANWGSPFQGDYGNVSVLLGKGDGTFETPVSYTGLTDPFQVTLADFNGDGNLDLAVVANATKKIFIALGKGDGTFLPPRAYQLPVVARPIAVGDFNGDGKLDLAMPGTNANPPYHSAVGVMLGNGDGTFQPAVLFKVDIGPTQLAVGDFNGDGRPDIAALGGTIPSTISILLNTTTPWPGAPQKK